MKVWARQKGFTIVELLVVIVVIAILASVTVVAYNGVTQRARDADAVNYLREYSQRYQQRVVEKGGNLSSSEFMTVSDFYQGEISLGFKSAIQGGNITKFCTDTMATAGLTHYFFNSSDKLTPTRGVCTGPGAGEYTLE